MQEIIVLSVALAALLYLAIKFFYQPKGHNCEKCGQSDQLESKKH